MLGGTDTAGTLHEFYDTLKQSEMEMLIRQSGSTAKDKNEKIRSGRNYIREIHLYNSGTVGLGINMISCGDQFVLDFKQSFASDKYVKAFCSEFEKLGLAYTVSDAIPFLTPGDALIKRDK